MTAAMSPKMELASTMIHRNKALDEMNANRLAYMLGIQATFNPGKSRVPWPERRYRRPPPLPELICILAATEIAQMAKQAGYPAIYLNCEHSGTGLQRVQDLACACLNVGISLIVVAPDNTQWISRALDCGVQGVIIPRTNDADMARTLVKYSKHRPVGERPLAETPNQRYRMMYNDFPFAEAMEVANERTLAIPMIETVKGLENIEEICAVPGVDAVFVGTWDLMEEMGILGQYDNPLLMEAYDKIAAAAEKASVNGRKVFVGCGGLEPRPDLIKKLTEKHKCIRLFMASRDNTLASPPSFMNEPGALMKGMRAEVAGFQALAEKIGA
ncbi:hypothetical protein MNV49_001256 [Pseudohyphozyma bogoriensis]|nr:hypothetical protein MNV49_001256 [Pseudohyphozyma bogoriensis]